MIHVSMQDVAQGMTLPDDDRFDLGIVYVGRDERSVANLQALEGRCRFSLAIFIPSVHNLDSTDSSAVEVRVRGLVPPHVPLVNWSTLPSTGRTEVIRKAFGSNESPRIFLDVSAFPRTTLSCLMDAFRELAAEGTCLNLTLGYRLAQFTPPRNDPAPPNRRVAPVGASFAGWPRRPGLPVHLIVGLGYERDKAQGAVEYLQPSFLSLFSPQSPIEEFAEQVAHRNRLLLENTPSEQVFTYEVLEPAVQFAQLSSMLGALVGSTKPVLLPFGPKIFFAVCLLMSLAYQEVSVWHVSGEELEESAALLPSEHMAFLHVRLTPSEVEAPPGESPTDVAALT